MSTELLHQVSADGTPAVFSDAVRVNLAECSLLFISGKTAVDEDHKRVGSTMTEQTEQVQEHQESAGP
jgi:enamine deaminase RidA (YjgF/YER057c/UK114 family)